LDFENLPQIGDCLVAAECQDCDFLFGIISRGKERKALDVVPVKVRERNTDLLLLVADGAKVSAQISQSCARVNNGDLIRIGNLQAGGVAAELLKTGIADGNGSPRTIKLELHGIVFMQLSPNRAKNRTILHSAGRLTFRISDPAPLTPGMQPRRNRGVRYILFVMPCLAAAM
jgi:hypothetical protein